VANRYAIGFLVDSVEMTKGVINGMESLGGSESACLGTARALRKRGHVVHIFASKLDPSCVGPDHAGVQWFPLEQLPARNRLIEYDVFVVLRIFQHLTAYLPDARLRLLWHQDLLLEPLIGHLMGVSWAIDEHVYVSDYQRLQYEDRVPELAGHGWVTKNGFDPSYLPSGVTKSPHRIIHISRPERGLGALLEMWPAVRDRYPQATLAICRYNSMYDAGGWGRICAAYDAHVTRLQNTVGGVEWLGELGKADLYRAIAEAAVMWYPGAADFAETSCLAAVEAQACGTPFVGSYKGALPETVPSGILLRGNGGTFNALPGDSRPSAEYLASSLAVLGNLMEGCARLSVDYRELVKAGKKHVEAYTFERIAEEWERHITETFTDRYESNRIGVLRQLLHYDDHVAAQCVAQDIRDTQFSVDVGKIGTEDRAERLYTHMLDRMERHRAEATAALERCDRVINGGDLTPDDYSSRALAPDVEAESFTQPGTRFHAAIQDLKGCTRVLDVACGNGSFAVALCLAYPDIHVTGLDYAEANVATARAFAAAKGVADRCTFHHALAWDLATQTPVPLPVTGPFDGAFVGEFLEHVADTQGLIDHIESYVSDGGRIIYTMPSGPFGELATRGTTHHCGHVHHFCGDDIESVFGQKSGLHLQYLDSGITPRGNGVGHWLVSYVKDGSPTGVRNYAHRILTTRPKPMLTVGLIAGNAALDLAKCLEYVWPIADEIIVGDCGSTDRTAEIAREYGARVLTLPKVEDHPEGFAGARNAVLQAASGDWFFWIDCDEWLIGGEHLHRYIDTNLYHGYVIHQRHLHLGGPEYADKPVRIFRTGRGVQFFGCVHEQPGLDHGNGDVTPALELTDVCVAHTGYLTEGVRRGKMLYRNLPLLLRDRDVFPHRRLGLVLVLRDYVNLGNMAAEGAGVVTDDARAYFEAAIGLFQEHFADPSDKYHWLARQPWYEAALEALGLGFEMEYGLGGTSGSMPKGAVTRLKRVRVQTYEEYHALVAHQMAAITKQMRPDPIKTDPFVLDVREGVAA
jgi:glycosyltransferase involved in cell wall biosynthesis/2-polyprenyl-3-methyl-5-hydroxy-6-metoxy-1,4-benzoquinol methylase